MSHSPSLPSMTADDIPSSAPRTTSLAAAATMNAGLRRESINEETTRAASPRAVTRVSPSLSPRSPPERHSQRNSIAMNLNLNDPALPAPGELQTTNGGIDSRAVPRAVNTPPRMSSPGVSRSPSAATGRHHGRQPSAGEVYQEMEQEQEAQVNRLLQTIRLQQQQLDALRSRLGSTNEDLPSPTSDHRRPSVSSIHNSSSYPAAAPIPVPHSMPLANRSRRQSTTSPVPIRNVPHSFQLSHFLPAEQENAVMNSGQSTPVTNAAVTPGSSVSGAMRDEVSFYQAEANNLKTENQLLKARIKVLERQVSTPQNPLATGTLGIGSSGLRSGSEDSTDGDVDTHDIK